MTDALTLLETRKSPKIFDLVAPGPSPAEIDRMLAIASRVPDHGKLAPWRFIVIEGEAQARAGEAIASVFARDNPGADADRLAIERTRLSRAPLVIAVVSRAGAHVKIPEWEQLMSGAAACTLLLLAAHAMGYAGTWLTEWYAYDARVRSAFGLAEAERFVGFVHIGTLARAQEDRPRPALADIVTRF
ncbi:nitroreductase family protein [Ancylobacter lacus]|uniref:nitroreductase family protein n=1 Tax=Ancylobacter lacus TaxID=2579970 RepID=UPI001BCB5D1E|nr:nitroreductase [Ancylobacter lacus]MBS7540778.1 nitroreductase [Ancylobacter lacus]